MKFLVNLFNHSDIGQRSLEDVVGIWGHQMRELGHTCVWETKNANFYVADDVINVLVEGFVPQHEAILAEAHRRGARFLILATEEPTPKGFNHGTQREMTKRQFDFHHAGKFADGIMYLVPGPYCQEFYSQFAPSEYVELGYAKSLERKYPNPPEYEFGFYGSLTTRRLRILKKLANRSGRGYEKAVKVVADFKTQQERDQQMSRAKVIVQVRKFEAMGLVSSSRCNTALHLGRPVVAEPHDLSKPWDEIVNFSSSLDHFYNLALMAATNWKAFHANQMERFKTKLSPELCVGHALEKLGMTDDQWKAKRAAA